MYVSAGAPLPQNSLNGMPASQQARMQTCIDQLNFAAAQAKQNAYIYPSPLTGLPISKNLVADMVNGQQQAQPAAYSILTNQPVAGSPSLWTSPSGMSSVPAPEVVPLNASASGEYGCKWAPSVRPPAPQSPPRVFLQPAPNTPQVTPPQLPSAGSIATPPVTQQVSNPQPAWSPCPAGVPFQNRYIAGAPVCGTTQFGLPGASAGFERAYAGISGLGDSPNWADAFGSYQTGSQSIGSDILSAIRQNPWIALLIAAGIGFGVAAVGKIR
jgi:hypothetical protein